MTKQEVRAEIHRLESYYGSYKSKCLRNYRMYTYSSTVTLDTAENEVVGFFQKGTFDIEDDTTSAIQENVIGSCIDTLTSKIASQKVRPFFNTVNGTFKEMQIARQAQTYFDILYEENNVNSVVTNAFRNACVFDKGIVKISEDGIENCIPWNVYVDPREVTYSNPTQIAEKLVNVPGRIVRQRFNKKCDPRLGYTVYHYYDTIEKVHAIVIDELDEVIINKYDSTVVPYIFIHYSQPIKGSTSQSVVDQLYGIQTQIDELLAVIKDSITMNPGMSLIVPRGNGVKTSMLSNRTGQIIEYDSLNGAGAPIQSVTPDVISPQFIQLLDKLKNDAYETVGISQLSATSQKPAGLNSGVALSTMEDIESDRFETQLNSVIRLYVDIAKACLDVFPPEMNILPDDINRADITWADIVAARNNMKIQFSAAQSLSKDPSEKLKQLQSLAEAGIIPTSHIAQLMELPDIQKGYNIANNAFNAVYTFIDSVIRDGVPEDIPEYLPTEKGGLLETEILTTILSLAVKPEINSHEIAVLKELFSRIQTVQMNSQTNAEMMAVQQLSAELGAALPGIQSDATAAAEKTMNGEDQ